MTYAHADDLQRSIEKFIKGQFAPFDITSVEVYEDLERDGFAALDVIVFFNGTTADLALKEPSGFITKLRQYLAELGEHAFPLVSFRSASLRAA